ncbi:putative flavoprotein involved in K+ transport [Arboricoccus pini]|uniref:Putative flavoprotein involved in K+ transport n=1 Tax=Arboricoccus pini TaxID=1963835 RepID=A0A212RKJ1_9PROT|nr:MSMEG_0569 family flavin-dependent oxidoreductase [Arboricoccus pini]SNB72994.1 putative flavoprotein involved in K+ transport [Arboricoccus pini]
MEKAATPPHYPVIVIGGGQAGLSVSHYLMQQGIAHLVIEKRETGHAWANERWDSFCLVTPNWQCQLPDFPYPGPDPDGFMLRDEIVAYVQAYRDKVHPPLLEHTAVTALTRQPDGPFELATERGPFTADAVVVAISGYHLPVIPRIAERLPRSIHQLHSRDYKNPDALPEGAVLVVGSGQSGCQIAEDLHLAGRKVYLCVGRAPKSPRRYRGRDAIAWLHDMGYYDVPVEQHPLKEGVRKNANHYLTGRDGGREIDLRRFATEGMELYGRLLEIDGSSLRLGTDLKANLDAADKVAEGIKSVIDKHIAEKGIDAPSEPPYRPVWQPTIERDALDLEEAGINSVVWATGFRSDFSFVRLPVFDGTGYPTHRRGMSAMPGLAFIGLPWLHSWGSGRFAGIARDAGFIVEQLAAWLATGASSRQGRTLNGAGAAHV